VVTTAPTFAPRLTGEVVISVPFLNVLEFDTIPVIEPSEFCVNFPKIGMSSVIPVFSFALLPPPPKENPDDFFAAGVFCTGFVLLFTALLPFKLNVGLFLVETEVFPPFCATFGLAFLEGLFLEGDDACKGCGVEDANREKVALFFRGRVDGGVFSLELIEIVAEPVLSPTF